MMLEERHAGLPQHLFRNECDHLLRRANGLFATPDHARSECQEVVVVRIVPGDVDAEGRTLIGDVRFIRMNGVLISSDGVQVSSDPHIDMSRHVNKMTRARHQAGEMLSRRQCTFGVDCLDGVDVKMVGSGMVRVCSNDPFEAR